MGKVHWLFEEIRKLHVELRDDIMGKFARSLPLADELTDRWERARFLGFGEDTTIYDSVLVIGNVKVGSNTWIGPGCVLDGSGGLEIGDFCSVSASCHIYSHDTIDWALSGGKIEAKRLPTSIGSYCYLGPHSVITAGVKIGNHCLIGANSLVKNDVSDYSFVAGNPAEIKGTVIVKESGEIEICKK